MLIFCNWFLCCNNSIVVLQHDPWDSVRPLPRPLSSGVAESNEERNIEDAKGDNIEVENFFEVCTSLPFLIFISPFMWHIKIYFPLILFPVFAKHFAK